MDGFACSHNHVPHRHAQTRKQNHEPTPGQVMPLYAERMLGIVRAAGLDPEAEAQHDGEPLYLDKARGVCFKTLTLAPIKGAARCKEKVENEVTLSRR